MEWEKVIFNEPRMTISGNCIYFNSKMRDIVLESGRNGVSFFKTKISGEEILSCKAGDKFKFSKKKNEARIICRELANYISDVYGGKSRFILVLEDGYYILKPIK